MQKRLRIRQCGPAAGVQSGFWLFFFLTKREFLINLVSKQYKVFAQWK